VGVFVCDPCSKHHSKFGSRISVVKSLSLATQWTPAEVDILDRSGNEVANAIWECHLQDWDNDKEIVTRDPNEEREARRAFCKKKYLDFVYFDKMVYQKKVQEIYKANASQTTKNGGEEESESEAEDPEESRRNRMMLCGGHHSMRNLPTTPTRTSGRGGSMLDGSSRQSSCSSLCSSSSSSSSRKANRRSRNKEERQRDNDVPSCQASPRSQLSCPSPRSSRLLTRSLSDKQLSKHKSLSNRDLMSRLNSINLDGDSSPPKRSSLDASCSNTTSETAEMTDDSGRSAATTQTAARTGRLKSSLSLEGNPRKPMRKTGSLEDRFSSSARDSGASHDDRESKSAHARTGGMTRAHSMKSLLGGDKESSSHSRRAGSRRLQESDSVDGSSATTTTTTTTTVTTPCTKQPVRKTASFEAQFSSSARDLGANHNDRESKSAHARSSMSRSHSFSGRNMLTIGGGYNPLSAFQTSDSQRSLTLERDSSSSSSSSSRKEKSCSTGRSSILITDLAGSSSHGKNKNQYDPDAKGLELLMGDSEASMDLTNSILCPSTTSLMPAPAPVIKGDSDRCADNRPSPPKRQLSKKRVSGTKSNSSKEEEEKEKSDSCEKKNKDRDEKPDFDWTKAKISLQDSSKDLSYFRKEKAKRKGLKKSLSSRNVKKDKHKPQRMSLCQSFSALDFGGGTDDDLTMPDLPGANELRDGSESSSREARSSKHSRDKSSRHSTGDRSSKHSRDDRSSKHNREHRSSKHKHRESYDERHHDSSHSLGSHRSHRKSSSTKREKHESTELDPVEQVIAKVGDITSPGYWTKLMELWEAGLI